MVIVSPTVDGHIRAVHDKFLHICEQCYYTTTKICQLKNHVEVVHKGIRSTCDECEYTATRKENVKKHKKEVHENTSAFICDQCNHKVRRKIVLWST